MPEFWHAWARQLAPAVVARNAGRINQIDFVPTKIGLFAASRDASTPARTAPFRPDPGRQTTPAP